MNIPGYQHFQATVLRLTGIDLDAYRTTQLQRRLLTIMRRQGAADLAAYAKLLASDPEQVKTFLDFLTINVSEFFRNPDKFIELKEVILPELLRQSSRLKIWSAGCANGAEPYSVSMLLAELDPQGQHEIWATDLDAVALSQAAEGFYTEKDLRNLSPERRQRHLIREGEGYRVKPEIQRRVRFEQHNLLADPFPVGAFDLILCRNVVIYFTEEAKDQLYRRFHTSLKPQGVLFVGGTESLLKSRELGFVSVLPFFYKAVKAETREE